MKSKINLTSGKWKFLKLFLFIGFLLISASIVPSQRVEAATTKSAALKAYNTFLKKAQETDGSGKKFAIMYITNDSIPELYYNGTLYTYKNGSMIPLYEESVWELSSYYKKTGIIVEHYEYTYGKTRTEVYSYGKIITTGKENYKYKMTHEIVYKLDSSGNVTKTTHKYYTETKTISKKTFNKKLAKLVGSKTEKSVSSAKHKNTSENRKKYLK